MRVALKILLAVISLISVISLSSPVFASQKQYFDWGPYYPSSQVLGFSFSSLENLPAINLPANLNLPAASGILPNSPFYPLEKIAENTQLFFTFDPVKKEELRVDFAAERLSEAKTLMDQGQTGAASQALADYGKTLDTITQNLPAVAQRNNQGAQNLINKLEESAANQTVVAVALSLSVPPAQAEGWTESANTARQMSDKVAEVKGQPAIPEGLSDSIQNLKSQGLISQEESNKLYSLKTRSEVREELAKLASSNQLPLSEIVKLDEAVAKRYPEVQDAQLTNLQAVELRSYQALAQPSDKIVDELEKWQGNPTVPPSNDIKPYLWYNRAQDLAEKIDLTNFSPTQQTELAKSYPQAVTDNPTYTPPTPSPSPSPAPPASGVASSPAPSPAPAVSQDTAASPSPASSSVPVTAQPYLGRAEGALPGQPTYIFKQLGEGVTSIFTFDPAEKAKFRMLQAERRLAEAEALSADPKKASLYEATLKNYQSAVADASALVKDLKDPKTAKKVAEKLEAQAARHEVVFEKGLLPPPSQNPKLLTEIIKASEDAMDRSADALDRPSLPAALSARLGDLKAQGLILPEEADDLTRSSSREEVRGKIRKLVELETFPLTDAKKLDESQSFVAPADYNQLTEVRKVEELQTLRSVQSDLAQTPTLKSNLTSLGQRRAVLESSFDPSLIRPEDLAGRESLVKTYEKLSSEPRPINSGQFGREATPGAKPTFTPPSPQDAVLTTCPEGAVFKQFEGCVWADSNKRINDYDQYKCEGPRQYYSFAAKKCVAYDPTRGYQEDSQPTCPVGYQWSWQNQSCQTSAGGILPYPSPSSEPEPIDEKEIEKRSKNCPEGSSYKAPQGCTWDKDNKSVYDSNQYRCSGRGQYYSFKEQKCVSNPKEGEPYPDDAAPVCKESATYWNWSQGKCVSIENPLLPSQGTPVNIDEVRPNFITYNSPFYFLKQAGERVQQVFAFTPQAREQVSISQAKERLAEAIDALKKDDEAGVKKALSSYTSMMQDIVADVSKEQLTEGAKKEIAQLLSKEAVEHNLLLQKLQALAPAEADTAISAATSATILGVDKAADIAGEEPIPADVKAKIEALPEKMISEEDKKTLLEMDSRVEARLKVGELATNGILAQTDANFLNEDFTAVDQTAKLKIEELKKLEEIATATEKTGQLVEKVEKNEQIAQKLQEFERTFEPGKEIPAEIRPYVRLTRINEIAQTIRPDVVRLEDFQNRKDVLLAVATLQEEFKPTYDSWKQVEDYRRRNPNGSLPPELARVEALSYSLGVRNQAGPCFLPTPPFAPNTPCPAPGAAIPIASYANYNVTAVSTPATDKDGKPFVYGQGPKPEKAGVCTSGYYWMYDSGGWCMADGGNYTSSYSNTPTGTGPGYTPYSSYYTAPGAPPTTYGYPSSGYYPSSSYSYSAPSYWGPASTAYTTTPPSGTVPGSGPKPTSPGQCPSGFHWMSDSGGWCMADGQTYVPAGATTSSTAPSGGYNCGSQPYDPVTKRCKDGACPGGFNWDGSKCVAGSGSYSSYYSPNLTRESCGPGYYWDGRGCIRTSPTDTSYYSPSSYQYGCTPGYYWNGSKCVAGSNEGSGWSDSASRSQSWCQPPSNGCGSNSYWDYGSCYCRSSSTYYGGTGPSPSNQCQGLSCGGGAWLDYSTCSCKYSGGSGTTPTGSTITCYPPSAGCPGGWYDYGTCSCKTSYSSGSYSSGSTTSSSGCANVSASSCGSGWYFDSAACTCRQSSTTSGSTTTSGGTSSGGSSSGSCPSGYHWMDNSWCMQDGSGGSTSSGGNTSTSGSGSTTTTTSGSSNTSGSGSTTTSTESSSGSSGSSSSSGDSGSSSSGGSSSGGDSGGSSSGGGSTDTGSTGGSTGGSTTESSGQ